MLLSIALSRTFNIYLLFYCFIVFWISVQMKPIPTRLLTEADFMFMKSAVQLLQEAAVVGLVNKVLDQSTIREMLLTCARAPNDFDQWRTDQKEFEEIYESIVDGSKAAG